jgi:TolB-like protein/class 3 adenylate cyclase/Flp pilus assembly protein TadD
VERRLSAILSADAVGFSRLMAEDEEGTARAIAACRRRISDCVGQRGGRVVDAPGDNLLAEFPSVVDAVRCAVDIQAEMEGAGDGGLRFRIGVNLGDVLVDGERIVGEGVNVAARLESLAEPGGICVSGTVFDQVEGKVGLEFEDAGEQAVKNHPKPIRIYRVAREPGVSGERAVGSRERSPKRRLGALLAAALGLALLGAWLLWTGREAPTRAAPAIEKSIAVLPFANMSQDAANEPFTIGIHDDLLSHLSRIGSLKTISRTSVLQYRNTTKTIPQIADELGVATILEGGVQRAGDRVRINVQLIDAATDTHVWADTYDRQLTAANVFAIQSEIATAIAEALQVTLSLEERRRIEAAPTQNLAAFETYFLGKQLLEKRTVESLSAAIEYFQQVVDLDPDLALAHSGLADAYFILPEYTSEIDPEVARQRSDAAARRALALDPELPEALTSMGWNHLIHHYEWQEAEALLRRAVEVEPHNTNALHWLSHVLSWQGRHAEALDAARRAVSADPLSRLMSMNLSYILMDAGDFEASIEVARETIARFPGNSEQYGNLWATYLRAGRPEDAMEAIQKWAAATGRDVGAAREVGEAFVRHAQTGALQTLTRGVLERLEIVADDLGQVYAFVGDGENALAALEAAFAERSGSRSVLSMKVNPGYDFIRDDLRFVALMDRVGLER